MDGCIQFALLTGVTKFGKVSVFSDLNNLNDISMDRRYLALCGVTDEELRQEFAPSIRLLAQAQNMTYEETCQRLQITTVTTSHTTPSESTTLSACSTPSTSRSSAAIGSRRAPPPIWWNC